MPPPPDETPSARQLAGALVLFAGIGVCLALILDVTLGLPWDLPRTWYVHRPLWGLVGLGLFAFGWALQRGRRPEPATWRPAVAGRRFHKLVIYSRADCHLCDDAKALLATYLDYLPEIEEVDIDTEPELADRYGTSIPVVALDGREYFRGRIDEVLLRRLIDGTQPAVSESEP
ncbi:MAG: glutaredoxin family protein [Planctomycetaceae bacterium]